MNEETREHFRKVLTQSIEKLLQEAGKTLNEMTEDKANFPDPTDRASLESDRNFELRIRDRERKLIQKIREAIARIDNGTFGICEECEEEIQMERLLARPVTTLCVECKEKQEAEEKSKEGRGQWIAPMTAYRHV